MTNSIHPKDHSELEQPLLDDLDRVKSALTQSETIDLDSSIDKQILAAAYRESQLPRKAAEYRFSFWRKLSLPLYIGSGFIFTVLAYNTLLQPVSEEVNTQESASTIISIESSEESNASLSEPTKREKRALPKLQAPEAIPQRIVTEPNSSAIDFEMTESEEERLIEQGIYTGNELKKADFPEKEAWAREIIGLLRDGDALRAKNELNEFKKIYPNYPIEEQIKVLTQ